MSQSRRKSKAVQKAAKEKKKGMYKKLCAIVAGIAAVAILAVVVINLLNKPTIIDEENYPVATMEIKDYGTVTITLYPNEAPNTVRNFISLANSGFYDGQKFLRVCENFCLQFGSPDGTMSGGPGYTIKGEFSGNGFNTNTIKHEEGILSMARSSSPDSAGSQFFICTGTNRSVSNLDGQYAAFGKVTGGLDIIKQIDAVDHDNSISAGGGVPYVDIIVTSIRVDTKGINYAEPDIIKQ